MNAKIKTFLMSLVLLPVALCFSACGAPLDSKASVNISGNYNQESSAQELQDYANDEKIDDDSFLNSFKLSIDLATSGDNAQNVSMNLICKTTSTNVTETYLKFKMSDSKNSGNMTMYYTIETTGTGTSGNAYVDMDFGSKKGKYKFDINSYMFQSLAEMTKPYMSLSKNYNFSSVESLNLIDDKAVMKAVSGNSTKFKVTLVSGDDTADLYYVFENNKFIGFQIINYTYTDSSETTTINLAMCVYDDDINFDTNGYTDYPTTPTE